MAVAVKEDHRNSLVPPPAPAPFELQSNGQIRLPMSRRGSLRISADSLDGPIGSSQTKP